MSFLLVITMGTQNGPKIIVKVVIGPFKGPKLSFIMCWLLQFGPKKVQKTDNEYCNYLQLHLPKSTFIVH